MKYEDFLLFDRKPCGVAFVEHDRPEVANATKQSFHHRTRTAGPIRDNAFVPAMPCFPGVDMKACVAARYATRAADFPSAPLS
jgi:hypothetical protein